MFFFLLNMLQHPEASHKKCFRFGSQRQESLHVSSEGWAHHLCKSVKPSTDRVFNVAAAVALRHRTKQGALELDSRERT